MAKIVITTTKIIIIIIIIVISIIRGWEVCWLACFRCCKAAPGLIPITFLDPE
jgi:hypothetical protein